MPTVFIKGEGLEDKQKQLLIQYRLVNKKMSG